MQNSKTNQMNGLLANTYRKVKKKKNYNEKQKKK